MRRLMLLLATACILLTQGAAEPANPGPWAVSTIAKSDSHRHAKLETGDTPGPLKYLHLEVKFAPNATERKLHNFRVVDSKGKTVGEYFGGDSDKSQLVFERETPWASLNGLYLEGQGRRVPLFATQPVQPAPTTVVQPTVVQPRPVPPPTFVEPRGLYVPPSTVTTVPDVRPTYVPPTETVLVEPRERVVVGGDRDVVVHEHHGDTGRVVEHYHTGSGGGGGGGHGHGVGGGHGIGGGSGDGGCPYGDACPICGTGAEEGVGALDPWAFDEMGQGRYDDLLARIENSGFAPNLGAPGMGGGSGGGAGSGVGSGSAGAGGAGGFGPAGAAGLGSTAGMGSGLGNGQGGDPLPGMASTGSGPGSGLGSGPGTGPGRSPGVGPGSGGPGAGPGTGGPGQGPGSGQGQGLGPGEGQGPGSGEGQGPGPGEAPEASPEERFGTPGPGGPGSGGPGPGAMAGPMEGAPSETMPNEPIPGENNPMNMNPMNSMANNGSGGGGGAAGNIGPQNLFGPRVVNPLAPDVRFHNLAPEPDLPEFNRPVFDVYGYRPTIVDPRYRLDTQYRFNSRLGQPGYGGGGGGGIGNGVGGRYDDLAKTGLPVMPELPEMMGEIVLYISAGNDGEQGGTIYQVNDTGRVLGKIKLPYQATGLALHRDDGLIAVTPRDRGKIYRVDDKGELSVIMENNSRLPHPIDVGVAGDSDTILVADSSADVLAATDITGREPIVFQRFETAQYDQQKMSVAVTRDKHVMYGTDAQNGIYRFGGDKETASHAPMLPGSGGVAADPKSLKWAATQSPNLIHLYEGEMPLKTLKLGPGRSIYRQGLLSFAPSGAVVVATRPSDEVDQDVRLLAYETAEGKEGQVLSLFDWDNERMLDFVVGPRMIWEGHQPSTYKSKY